MAILDADKEGFLRNYRSLIQTIGRAARNDHGHVIMYADKITDSMDKAISETRRRREIQMAYNKEHGITPKTIKKAINDVMGFMSDGDGNQVGSAEEVNRQLAELSRGEVMRVISSMEDDMAAAAQAMDFERAAQLRDEVVRLKAQMQGESEKDVLADLKKTARKGVRLAIARIPPTAARAAAKLRRFEAQAPLAGMLHGAWRRVPRHRWTGDCFLRVNSLSCIKCANLGFIFMASSLNILKVYQ